ncbi:tolloid-like protein 2 [Thrips palmi]|uniref:Tolloid-like protein 2 n=1 Tax=Thrips palmi TaxID=161013 RepID=A0A6P8Z4V3_THRPL|nr:tolloid-like protein 2 [Thrips palmi]
MVQAHSLRSGLGVLVCLLAAAALSSSECDRTFSSRPGGPMNGTFTAPVFINPDNHARQCIYVFQAQPRQRVEVSFTLFNLRGTPPECIHEYLDVYSEVQSPDPRNLINSAFGGRYCGPIPPRRRVSFHRTIALGFYTDKTNSTAELFAGRYTFINDSVFEVGTPQPNAPCSYTVRASTSRNGSLVSPTYPGAYPKDLYCSYTFLGIEGQRVRLEFRDFDLFYGGPHCPFDVVKVYDGPTNESAVIGTYCGQQRNLVLYSSETSLFVTFTTLQRAANTQNRGFKGMYEFSEGFVKLDFISTNDGEHIRGSECDQKILSKKESSGFVFSPNYPFPYMPKIVCRYFIYGMQDSQNLERVRLDFMMFEITNKNETCSDGYLKIYLKGQEAMDAYDKFDHELCGDGEKTNFTVGTGSITVPLGAASLTSDGPRLVMVFSSGEMQGRGFKAKYTFETEYRIPGTAAPDGTCTFTYRSSGKKKGDFNSPRYPSNYPAATNCTYMFLPTPNEQVTVVFDHFKVRADQGNATTGAYGSDVCHEDWLEMYNLYHDGTETLIGRYCSTTAPGPIDSNRGAVGLKVLLHSDNEAVFSGFKAHYSFEPVKPIYGACGGNVSKAFGVIQSPNYPANYDGPKDGNASKTCNWYLTVRLRHKILLNFESFAVEGEPSARGCPAAVVRLWLAPDAMPIELCGEKGAADKWQYVSEGPLLRVSFVIADKSVGAQGFRGVFTEVAEPSAQCSQFTCEKSGFCIADNLRCNQERNCGAEDDSDELNCLVEAPVVDTVLVLVGCAGGALFLAVAFCAWCHHRKRRRRRRQMARLRQRRHFPESIAGIGHGGSLSRSLPRSLPGSRRQHACDELGHRFASVDSV